MRVDTVAFHVDGAFQEICRFLGHDRIGPSVWLVLRKNVLFPSVWSGGMSLFDVTVNDKGMIECE